MSDKPVSVRNLLSGARRPERGWAQVAVSARRSARGLMPNSLRNARLKFEMSPKPLSSATSSTLSAVLAAVEAEQQRLNAVVAAVEAGTTISPPLDAERFDLVLGITCHAIYHAGQIQLVKRLLES